MYYNDEMISEELDTEASTADSDAGDTTGQGEYNKDTGEEEAPADSQAKNTNENQR